MRRLVNNNKIHPDKSGWILLFNKTSHLHKTKRLES